MTLPTARNTGSAGLHLRYEKAGLIFDQAPIPWNADAAIVEANLRLPRTHPPEKQDFALALSTGGPRTTAELIRKEPKDSRVRVLFRFPIPPHSCTAQLSWREHSLGQIEVPVIAAAEFAHGLALQMPTVHAALGPGAVACQTFVNAQCRSLWASALLTSAGPLAPVVDLGLRLEVRRDEQRIAESPVHFTNDQLRSRQALLAVAIPKLRWTCEYAIEWLLGPRCLHTQRVRAIAKKKFLTSLRISATRFAVETETGEIRVVRWLPHRQDQVILDGIARIGPCFFVCSGEPGMAGVASFTVEAVTNNRPAAPLTADHEMLVTDGPMPVLAGMVAAAELAHIKHFTLATSAGTLGVLPLLPAPKAQFTSEGGFAPLDDFLWSPAADELLNDRLDKLLGS